MGLLRPHPSPYTTLAAGCYPALMVLANTGDFQGIIQGVDSKAYARLELYGLGEFLLQQDDSPLQWKSSWSFTLPYCINSGSIFKAPSLKRDAASCCLDVSTVGFASGFGSKHSFVFGNCFPTVAPELQYWEAVLVMDAGRGQHHHGVKASLPSLEKGKYLALIPRG